MFTINMQSGRDHAVLALCRGLYCSVYDRVFGLRSATSRSVYSVLITRSLQLLDG